MTTLRERWRAGRSAFVVLVGCIVAGGGNLALIGWSLVSAGLAEGRVVATLSGLGLALSVLAAWIVERPSPRTPKRFASVAVVATAIALLTVPGLVGGSIALAGALLGMLAAHEGPPGAPRG